MTATIDLESSSCKAHENSSMDEDVSVAILAQAVSLQIVFESNHKQNVVAAEALSSAFQNAASPCSSGEHGAVGTKAFASSFQNATTTLGTPLADALAYQPCVLARGGSDERSHGLLGDAPAPSPGYVGIWSGPRCAWLQNAGSKLAGVLGFMRESDLH